MLLGGLPFIYDRPGMKLEYFKYHDFQIFPEFRKNRQNPLENIEDGLPGGGLLKFRGEML